MSSIFGDLDLEGASSDPFKVNGGTYLTVLQKPEIKPGKNGKGLALSFKIKECDEDPQMIGRNISEWKNVPAPKNPKNPTEEDSKAAAWLKQRLVSLGVTDFGSGLAAQLEACGGKEYIVTVVENGEYTNVRKVTLADTNAAPDLGGNPFNPFKKATSTK